MKKKLLIIAFIFAFILVFAACEKQDQASEDAYSLGDDTKCEVDYHKYKGDHENLFLSKGDKIALISPSALPTREQTESTIKGLKAWGYEPVEGKYVCVKTRTMDNIMEDLKWALEDPEIKAIYCVRGGYGSSEVADRLSAQLIKSSDKLIIGYSDISVFLSDWTVNGLPSIHGCMSGPFNGLAKECIPVDQKILQGQIPSYKCQNSNYFKKGSATGILIGGNLSTFTSVLNTSYDCTKTNRPYILFLEDVEEDIQHVHRYLAILDHAGVLDKAAGIVFGEFTDTPKDTADYDGSSRGGEFKSIYDMISRQFLQDRDIPVAFGFPAGHGDTNYPLLMGENAKLKVNSDYFTLDCGAEDGQ